MQSRSVGLIALAFAIALALAGCDAFISTHRRIERATADLDAGKWGSASIELQRAVRKEPDNAQVWLLLARLSLDAANTGDALGYLDHAAKAGGKGRELDELRVRTWLALDRPKTLLDAASHHELDVPEPDLSIAVARADNEIQQPQRALALLEPILAAHPAATEARLAAAEALARQGEFDAALQQVDAAMANDRKSPLAPLMKARLLSSRRAFADAEPAYEAALKRMSPATPLPDRAAALAGLTEARLELGNVALASKSEAVLEQTVPYAPATQFLKARLELTHGNYVGGISGLQRLVANVPGYAEARLVLGAAQLSRGDLEQAQQNLEQVVHDAPDNVQARKLLAIVRLKLKEPDEALQVLTPALSEQNLDPQLLALFETAAKGAGGPSAALESALRAHPDDVMLRLNVAQAYLSASRAQDALNVLEATQATGPSEVRRDRLLLVAVNAVKGPVAGAALAEKLVHTRPRDVPLLDAAATYFLAAGAVDRARSLFKQAQAVDPHDGSSQLGLARIDFQTGNVAAAADLLRTSLRSDPQNVSVRITLADMLVRERAFAAAERVLEAAQGYEGSPDVLLTLAHVYLASKDAKKANAVLDRATAVDPRNAAVWSAAGSLLMQASQYDAALARYRKAAEIAPNDARRRLDIGKAQLALNQPAAARSSFDKALQIEPEWLPAVSGLTLIDLRAKDYTSALARVRQYLASHPGDPDGLSLEADVDATAGHLSDAAAVYEEAQKQRPEAATAVRLFQIREAQHSPHPQEPLEKWLALHPNDLAARTVLGNYYLGQRLWRKAAGAFETVVKQSPSDVVALNNLAWVYNEMGDPRAVSTAERAYTLGPSYVNVLDTYAWVLAHHDQATQALPLISKAATAAPAAPDVQYHYAYILDRAGRAAEARKVLIKLLARRKPFSSRDAAEQLLARLKV